MFAVVRHYHFKPEDSAQIDKMIRENFVPLIKKAKGFVRSYWLDTGKGEGASVSVFNDKAGADESIHLAADYVKDHMSKLITMKPEVIEGPVKAHDLLLDQPKNRNGGHRAAVLLSAMRQTAWSAPHGGAFLARTGG